MSKKLNLNDGILNKIFCTLHLFLKPHCKQTPMFRCLKIYYHIIYIVLLHYFVHIFRYFKIIYNFYFVWKKKKKFIGKIVFIPKKDGKDSYLLPVVLTVWKNKRIWFMTVTFWTLPAERYYLRFLLFIMLFFF